MKHSIRRQFALFFIGLMAITIGLCYVINSLFLEKYYSSKKVNTLKNAYTAVNQVIGSDSEKMVEELNRLCTVSNIAICVIDTEAEAMYVSKNGGRELEASLYRHIFGMSDEVADEIEANEKYSIEQTKGRDGDFLTLFGTVGAAGASVIMRTPLESIRESAGIANEFYAYVGIACGLIGALAFWLAAGRISKPIKTLSNISEQMVHLNFDAKYDGRAKNEIGLLGANINKLSSALETTIGELKTANNELQKDIEKKEQIDEMRKEFLSNVSHELKTPIALIQGYAEGLQELDDEESKAYYCEVIVDEAAKMNRLVQKLLTLNQLEFGNEVVTLERFDLSGLLNNYIQSAKLLAKQQDITVEMKEYDSLYVWGDELKTEEVITNYFSNAVNYCAGEKKIVIKLETSDTKARVSVYNTGERIPEEALPHLWEKFYKVDKARTREYGGSGVGLSIVKAIQDSLNQAYGVENCADGVMFWFELDLCEQTERMED